MLHYIALHCIACQCVSDELTERGACTPLQDMHTIANGCIQNWYCWINLISNRNESEEEKGGNQALISTMEIVRIDGLI